MKYFELISTLYLKEDIHYTKLHYKLSKFINEAFNDKDELSKLHFSRDFKYYSFDLIYNPNVKIVNKTYPKDNTYTFRLRSPDEELITTLQTRFRKVNNPTFSYLFSKLREVKKFFVKEIKTLTPVIVTLREDKDRYINWTYEYNGDIKTLHTQLHQNILKKYNSFYNEKLEPFCNFIQAIEFKNKKPQTIRIEKDNKEIKFFGNKFILIPNEDKISQKLAFFTLSVGLGEKNSFGAGFCAARR